MAKIVSVILAALAVACFSGTFYVPATMMPIGHSLIFLTVVFSGFSVFFWKMPYQ